VDGIEGYFRAAHIPCFAPSKETAQLEGSKAFSKDLAARHNIPTAEYRTFKDYGLASSYVSSISHNVVIKALGLAAGKGVVIPETMEETLEALKEMMQDRKFGDAGDEVVIEEFLEGEELSILTFSDGKSFKSLPPAQDHKRIFDGDLGPNTGGMALMLPPKLRRRRYVLYFRDRLFPCKETSHIAAQSQEFHSSCNIVFESSIFVVRRLLTEKTTTDFEGDRRADSWFHVRRVEKRR
jgi:phosphoribosylamine--glycine ligase/phosphoribosylformylglycinamidine cyclo-ligase